MARSSKQREPRTRQTKRQARERVAQMRAEQVRRERRRTMVVAGGFAVVLALVIGAAVWAIVEQRRSSSPSVSVPEVKSFKVPSRNHVKGTVDYPQTPPVGGNHAPVWLNCGFYAAPVRAENAVHDMEHGAVWITYQPDLPASQVDVLKKLATEQDFVTISPFKGLSSPVVASAWGKQLKLRTATDPKLDDFVRAYRVGPQTPEPGAPCTGGIGQPTG